MKVSSKRITVVAFSALAAVLVAAMCVYFAGFRLNLTASYPLGIWRLCDGAVTRGDIVFFRADLSNPTVQWAYANHLLPWNFSRPPVLMKKIVGEPGDLITLDGTVRINGIPIPQGVIHRCDQSGNTIPSSARAGAVPPNSFWLMSDYNSRSFDSRYFGAVPKTAILGRARAVFTWQ